MSESGYRTILRSSSIMGLASIINVATSIAKMKVAALLVGPVGVGLVGLYQSVIQTGSLAAGLGTNVAGTREIAARDREAGAARETVRLIARTAVLLGTAGALIVFFLRETIADMVFGDPGRGGDVAWLALGIALSVAFNGQTSILSGLRRVGDYARVQVLSAILATVVGIAALLLWGRGGLLSLVLAVPASSFLIGSYFTRRAQRAIPSTASGVETIEPSMKALIKSGIPLMVAVTILSLGNLAARAMIQQRFGAADLGQFQAAWLIAMTYIGFILGAMGVDYYPRLSAVVHDPEQASRVINEQIEVALLLAAPVVLGMQALLPWLVPLLYSTAFDVAADVLRWHLVGDLLKILSFPLGYLLMAQGASRTYLFVESLPVAVYLAALGMIISIAGIAWAGGAFILMYGVYFVCVSILARRRIGFRLTPYNRNLAGIVTIMCVALAAVETFWPLVGGVLGMAVSAAFALYTLRRFARIADLPVPAFAARLARQKASGNGHG